MEPFFKIFVRAEMNILGIFGKNIYFCASKTSFLDIRHGKISSNFV